jgi:rhodanese-related sulfurtransferase
LLLAALLTACGAPTEPSARAAPVSESASGAAPASGPSTDPAPTPPPAPSTEAVAPAAANAPSALPAAPARADKPVAALKAAMDAGPVRVLDVRTDAEFASGRVPGAKQIPIAALPARLAELSAWKDGGEVYVICARGGRSSTATDLLIAEGFTAVTNVEGGTIAWQEAGYPIERGDRGALP